MFLSVANEILTLILSWFLDNPELNWTPPKTLVNFMAKARSDDKPLVYIGFGSITVPNPKLVTERLIRAVQKSMPFRTPVSAPLLTLPLR
jgi:sterol 3beta-glucosyltransferase